MGYCVRQPDEITKYLRERFDRDYSAWARQQGTWPMRIGLHPPTTAQRSAEPVACHTWADQWRAYKGPGVVEYASARFPTGTHPMPKALVLRHPRDVAAAHPSTALTWQRCGYRLTALQRTFPQARFTGIIRRITDLDDRDYQRLVNTVTWLRVNPASGMLLRQLPIEGIDTKWLSRHAQLILALLGDSDHSPAPDADQPVTAPADAATARAARTARSTRPDPGGSARPIPARPARRDASPGRQRRRPEQVGAPAPHGRDPGEQGDRLRHHRRPPGTIVLHGQGFSVACYARVGWVRSARTVIYWGDIDAPGLQFVNDLRGHGITVSTILMDAATLHRFRHLAADGAGPQRSTLPNLTDTEQELYVYLAEYAATHGTGLLVEQERIPWQYAYHALTTAMNCPRPLRSVTL